MTIKRYHLRVAGRVQGVGYRAATLHTARALQLTGWVRNLPDGRVEIVAEGDLQSLNALHVWAQQGPRYARVEQVDFNEAPASGEFSDFSVL